MRNYPNVWAEGELFAFSGYDGPTDWNACFVASTLGDAIGLEFHTNPQRNVRVDLNGRSFVVGGDSVVLGDVIDLQLTLDGSTGARVRFLALDAHTIVGRVEGTGSQVSVRVDAESCEESVSDGVVIHSCEQNATALATARVDGAVRFSFSYSAEGPEAAAVGAKEGLQADLGTVRQQRMRFLEGCPDVNLDSDVTRTFYKACSVMKVNVESAQGAIPCRWTTPDRIPHRMMWLWDSAFHAIGLRHADAGLAEDALRAVFAKRKDDGFIPHMMAIDDAGDSEVTQPPVLAWATWEVFLVSKNVEFLRDSYDALKGYLEWDRQNRGTPVPELARWGPLHAGGESGMDNSPRFDGSSEFHAIDFSSFMANEFTHMALIAGAIGRDAEADYWSGLRGECIEAINTHLWDEETEFYYDRFFTGEWVRVKSEAAFAALFAGCATGARAAALLKHLEDPQEFGTAFPVPSVAANEPTYADDMWRGPTWINYNYLTIAGLERAGFDEAARRLAKQTIGEVVRWYKSHGCIFEYYDAEGNTPPRDLDRKEWKTKGHAMRCIRDYGWSASLFVDLVMKGYAQ